MLLFVDVKYIFPAQNLTERVVTLRGHYLVLPCDRKSFTTWEIEDEIYSP
jgi:hypothetical protein